HLLLPAVGVTTQEQTSEGGGQLRHYSPSWWHRSLSLAAALSIHGTGDGSPATGYSSTEARAIQAGAQPPTARWLGLHVQERLWHSACASRCAQGCTCHHRSSASNAAG